MTWALNKNIPSGAAMRRAAGATFTTGTNGAVSAGQLVAVFFGGFVNVATTTAYTDLTCSDSIGGNTYKILAFKENSNYWAAIAASLIVNGGTPNITAGATAHNDFTTLSAAVFDGGTITVGGVLVTGAANNGSGVIRLAVTTTTNFSNGQLVYVSQVGGTTEANGNWTILSVVDGTHIDLTGSTFTNAWTSGGYVVPVAVGASSPAAPGNLAAADTDLCLSCNMGAASGTPATPSGYNIIAEDHSGVAADGIGSYQIKSGAGNVNPSSANLATWAAAQVTLQAAVATGGPWFIANDMNGGMMSMGGM